MAKQKADKLSAGDKSRLWFGVGEDDFQNEQVSDNVIDENVGNFDKDAMLYFLQNVNLMRHLPRVADSLKPVERRGLVTLYVQKSFPGTKPKKSSVIVGDTMTLHPHGDGSIYGTLVGMAQPFTNPVPLIEGTGNFGNDEYPGGNAAMRYTEMTMSKYAQDCFFSDYDDDCIEKIFNTAKDDYEPMALPSKYPNILVNGGFGIATNSFCVPAFTIPDIVKTVKKLLKNPDAGNIYMLPDSPTGCDIVDNGSLRQICDTGIGSLHMRSTITIEENKRRPNVWILRVHNLPWMTSISSISDAIAKHTKDGNLPVKDIEDHSYPVEIRNANGVLETRKVVQYDIIINKALDPYQIREKLYKLTQLDRTISINFRMVTADLKIPSLSLRDLILIWINIRREYKRRLLNKKISKISARISLLEILTEITTGDNHQKVMQIIRSNTASAATDALMKKKIGSIKMNSYQAQQVVKQGILIFAKDSHARYAEELKEKKGILKDLLKKAKNPKFVDEEIEMEMNDLLKYDTGRKSRIVSESNDAAEITDTDHFIAITKLGMIKKLGYRPDMMARKKTPSLGAFKNQDYPLHGIVINNHDSLMMFDNFGKYSCVPVHEIESTDPSQYGSKVFDVSRLNGEIVQVSPFFSQDTLEYIRKELRGEVVVVTLTKDGMIKKTPIDQFISTRSLKNIKAMKLKQGDELVAGMFVIERKKIQTNLLVYTEKGNFSYFHSNDLASQSRDASGYATLNMDPDDACKGMCIVGDEDTDLLVVTEKGCVKRCELTYLGQPGKRKASSYIATLDVNDKIRYVDSMRDGAVVTICTRTTYDTFSSEDIPLKGRKAKCVKKVAVPLGNNIISVGITYP